ncbi:MAG: hypothetical protein GY749_20925 [Desulfobacteraceae bacterium]|nr:hypothetical protein [Desulfobacteraceae bacterium]
MEKKVINMQGKPTHLGTLWKTLRKPIRKFNNLNEISAIELVWPGLKIDLKHLKEFISTSIPENGTTHREISYLPLLYPMVYVYPFNLRIMSLSEISASMMLKMVTIRNQIAYLRPIHTESVLDLSAKLSECRKTKKGLEIDVVLELSTMGSPVWKNINTLYFRGISKDPNGLADNFKLCSLDEIQSSSDFYLSAKNRFKFCKLVGDSNGIHYSRYYAGLMGYERDFAQPYMVMGKILNTLKNGGDLNYSTGELSLEFRGPVYYCRDVNIKTDHSSKRLRFDVYSEGNARPSILGYWKNRP